MNCVLDIPIQLLIEATRNAESEALIFPLEFYVRNFDYKFVMDATKYRWFKYDWD